MNWGRGGRMRTATLPDAGGPAGATAAGTTPAIVAHPGGGIEIVPHAVRTPAPDEAVIGVAYGGICGSDLHYRRHGAVGESVIREPLVLGHEVVGVVARPAADGSGPRAGARVAVHPATPAAVPGIAFPADRSNLAPGTSYLGSAAHLPHTDGGFLGVLVLPTRMLRVIPAAVPLRTAVLAEPAAVALHAVRRGGELRGRTVAVIGSGPIGALVVALARRAGAASISVVDLHEHALRQARALGADRVLRAPGEAEIADIQAEVVFESSGAVAGLDSALRATRRGGRMVMVGLPPGGPQPFAVATAISREIDLIGSFRFVDEINEVLAALADGSLRVDPLITHEFGYEDAEQAFDIASDPSRSTKVVLRF